LNTKGSLDVKSEQNLQNKFGFKNRQTVMDKLILKENIANNGRNNELKLKP